MKKLIILNTEPLDYSYGGVCPFMRNMDRHFRKAFDVEYMVLPNLWRDKPGSTRMKYLIYLWLHKKRLAQADFILSHCPEGSYIASFLNVPYSHIYHGNSNPMTISRFRVGKYFAKVYDAIFKRIDKTCPLVYSVGPTRNSRQRKLFNPLIQNVKPKPIEERKGFIFAGRLESMKNVDRLITIYSKLPENIRNKHPFYIAGYGTEEENLKKQVEKMCLDGQVIFLGKIENKDMMLTDSDKRVMLMASSTEGMPTAIAEAFSVGLPVVSTAVGDIPSVVEHGKNGYLLPTSFRDEEYIKAIVDVLDNYGDFAESAYKKSELFNGEKITTKVIDDINKIIE